MKDEIKESVKNAIASQFQKLGKGQYITHENLIRENIDIMTAFYIYEYTLSNYKTVPYLRRVCREVIDDPSYGCTHIIAFRYPIKKKKKWVWGYPDESQGKSTMQEYDAKSAGIVKAQTGKAPLIGQTVVTIKTKTALEEAIKEKVEAEAKKAVEKEEAVASIENP